MVSVKCTSDGPSRILYVSALIIGEPKQLCDCLVGAESSVQSQRGGVVGILQQLWIAFVPVVIAFITGRLWEKARIFRHYGYIRAFIGKAPKVQIIVSNIEVSRFKFTNENQEMIRLQV